MGKGSSSNQPARCTANWRSFLFDLGKVYAGPVELRLPNGERREPDVFVVLKSDLSRVTKRRVEGAASFVTEFVSEFNAREDRVVKFLAYAAAGIREYLIIDARVGHDGFEFYRLNPAGQYEQVQPDADGRYHSEVLPGFWLKAEWFRQDPLPRTDHLMLEIAPDAYLQDLLAADQLRRGGQTSS